MVWPGQPFAVLGVVLPPVVAWLATAKPSEGPETLVAQPKEPVVGNSSDWMSPESNWKSFLQSQSEWHWEHIELKNNSSVVAD